MPEKPTETFGDLVQSWLDANVGAKQKDIARRVDDFEAGVSKVIKDKRNLEYETFEKYVTGLDLPRTRALRAYQETKRIIAARKDKQTKPHGGKRNRTAARDIASRLDAS